MIWRYIARHQVIGGGEFLVGLLVGGAGRGVEQPISVFWVERLLLHQVGLDGNDPAPGKKVPHFAGLRIRRVDARLVTIRSEPAKRNAAR